jgi:hypothetical protein
MSDSFAIEIVNNVFNRSARGELVPSQSISCCVEWVLRHCITKNHIQNTQFYTSLYTDEPCNCNAGILKYINSNGSEVEPRILFNLAMFVLSSKHYENTKRCEYLQKAMLALDQIEIYETIKDFGWDCKTILLCANRSLELSNDHLREKHCDFKKISLNLYICAANELANDDSANDQADKIQKEINHLQQYYQPQVNWYILFYS